LKNLRGLLLLLFGLLISAASVHAQVNYVTITGTVTDPSGHPYANASYSFILVDSAGFPINSAVTPNGGIFNAKPVRGNLNSGGFFSAGLVPNNTLTPQGRAPGTPSFWRVTISDPGDPSIITYTPPWVINYQMSVTTSVDISSALSALAQPIAFANLRTNQSTFGAAGGGVIPGTQSRIGVYNPPGSSIMQSNLTTDNATGNNLTVPGDTTVNGNLTAGTVVITNTATNNFVTTRPVGNDLTSMINSAVAGSDIYVGCGQYTYTGFLFANNGVHLHGPVTGNCANLIATGNPHYAVQITAQDVEIDHIWFTGNNEVCLYLNASTRAKVHDNSWNNCGSTITTDGTAWVLDAGGVDDDIEHNVISGSGAPMVGKPSGQCNNWVHDDGAGNNVLWPYWKPGAVWGPVVCPQSGGYIAVMQNVTNAKLMNNHAYGNNLYIGLFWQGSSDGISAFNHIEQNHAYRNITTADAEVGQGYGELCYASGKALLVGSMTRLNGVVTWNTPAGVATTIPYAVGDRIIVQFGFGAGGSDFNDGSPFVVTSVNNNGTTSASFTWNQPGPNDSDTTLTDIEAAQNMTFIGEIWEDTAGSGGYTAACARAHFAQITTSHNGQLYPTGALGVGGLSLNACDNCTVNGINIDTVHSVNQNQISGQQYAPNGIVVSGSYNVSITGIEIKDYDFVGIKCNQCNNPTFANGVVDGFGNGLFGFAYPANNNVMGVKLDNLTFKGNQTADIDFPTTPAGWGNDNMAHHLTLLGNTAASPTADAAVIQTPGAFMMSDSFIDGAGLGQTGTMKFGIVNSAPNALYTDLIIQNMTVAGGTPYSDSSNGTIFKNTQLINNVGKPNISGTPGTAVSYAVEDFVAGAGAGVSGMLMPWTIHGPCNGGLAYDIGDVNGGLYNEDGCIVSTGGHYHTYNATQSAPGLWNSTSATLPASIRIDDNTGSHYYFANVGACPTIPATGVALATCFGSVAKLNIATNGIITVNGLAMPPFNGTLVNGDLINNNASQFTDSGVPIASVTRFCGQATFTSSATSSALSCSWVAVGSHCQATAVGTPPATAVNIGATTTAGSVTLNASASISGTYGVACSAN